MFLDTGKLARLDAKLQWGPYVRDLSRRKVENLEEKVKKLREEVANLEARNSWGPGAEQTKADKLEEEFRRKERETCKGFNMDFCNEKSYTKKHACSYNIVKW